MKKGQATLLECTLRAESLGLAKILILEKIENSFHLVSVVSLTSVKVLQSRSVSKTMTSGSGNNKKRINSCQKKYEPSPLCPSTLLEVEERTEGLRDPSGSHE